LRVHCAGHVIACVCAELPLDEILKLGHGFPTIATVAGVFETVGDTTSGTCRTLDRTHCRAPQRLGACRTPPHNVKGKPWPRGRHPSAPHLLAHGLLRLPLVFPHASDVGRAIGFLASRAPRVRATPRSPQDAARYASTAAGEGSTKSGSVKVGKAAWGAFTP